MEMKTIKKELDVNAPKEKVWDVLLQDENTRIWYAEFSAGTYVQTDWKEGSKAIFTDGSGNGMIARIVENKWAEILDLEFTGELKDGKEEYDSDAAKAMQGGHETYRLSGENGATHLNIAVDMGVEYFEMMSAAWDRALQKIKSLAETA
jgi:uncharacterized protein YndB with AHSA1/START domain